MRWSPYCLQPEEAAKVFNECQFPIYTEGPAERIRKLIKNGYQFYIKPNQTGSGEFNISLKNKDGQYAMYADFSQMEGNCNGMMTSRLQDASGGESFRSAVSFELATFVIKNLASYLGDNVIHTSHYDVNIDAFKKEGWECHLVAPSIRGYSHAIAYFHMVIPRERMFTRAFSIGRNVSFISTTPSVVVQAAVKELAKAA
jgi:hypothetical protein